MRRFMNILALATLCTLTSASYALAGSHGHSSSQSHSSSHNSQPKKTSVNKANKAITGTKGGMGFIADPAPHGHNQNHSSSKVTKIMDPVRTKTGKGTTGGSNQITIVSTNLVDLKPTTPAGPTVRDHTVTKPVTPGKSRYDSITSEGIGLNTDGIADLLGLDGSGFGIGFTAPTQPRSQIVDHRTGSTGSTGGFTPNTQGPANSGPQNYNHPPRTGGK